jgi:hypothetical protein
MFGAGYPVSYQSIVIAISAGLKDQHGTENADIGQIATEIIGQHGRMPDYLRLPVKLATIFFDWSGLLSGGVRFQSKKPAAQQAQLNSWKYSSLGACRNFVRFYESLFLLIALQEDAA